MNVNNANGVAELNGVDIRMATIAEKLKKVLLKRRNDGEFVLKMMKE